MLRRFITACLDEVIELAIRAREAIAPSPIKVLLDDMTKDERRELCAGLLRDAAWTDIAMQTNDRVVPIRRRRA